MPFEAERAHLAELCVGRGNALDGIGKDEGRGPRLAFPVCPFLVAQTAKNLDLLALTELSGCLLGKFIPQRDVVPAPQLLQSQFELKVLLCAGAGFWLGESWTKIVQGVRQRLGTHHSVVLSFCLTARLILHVDLLPATTRTSRSVPTRPMSVTLLAEMLVHGTSLKYDCD